MKRSYKKAVVAVGAAMASLGVLRMTSAQTLITGDQSAVVDGWTITGWPGVALSVTSDSNGISIEKRANFTVANTGFPIGFSPVAGGSPATSIDIQDEQIANNTGQAFTGFDFILLNTGSVDATFASASLSNPFSPPSGYTGFTSADGGQELIYAGSQASGTTSDWGTDGSTLLIDAPAGSDFSLKELPTFGNGGGGGGSSPVPLPAAAWQSLVGLGALGLFGIARKTKRRLA
jgi:hypothetical protein